MGKPWTGQALSGKKKTGTQSFRGTVKPTVVKTSVEKAEVVEYVKPLGVYKTKRFVQDRSKDVVEPVKKVDTTEEKPKPLAPLPKEEGATVVRKGPPKALMKWYPRPASAGPNLCKKEINPNLQNN